MEFLIVVLILMVVVGIAAYMAALRAKATSAFAAQHGLTFARRWTPDNPGEFDLFRRGNTRRWSDAMTGAWNGRAMTYADYQYTVSSGRSSSTYTFSIVLLDLGCRLPQVVVRTRSALGRLAEETVGAPGIRFESVDFNDHYDVHCGDQNTAIELVDARMIETLLGCERGLNVAFGPERILVWSKRRNMQQLPMLLNDAVAVAGHVPSVVLQQYGAPQPAPAPSREPVG